MSQALTVARPYARAAFATAQGEGALAAWSQALGFAAHAAADPRVAALLPNPRLLPAEAVTLLAPEGASESFSRFLAVLADARTTSPAIGHPGDPYNQRHARGFLEQRGFAP